MAVKKMAYTEVSTEVLMESVITVIHTQKGTFAAKHKKEDYHDS